MNCKSLFLCAFIALHGAHAAPKDLNPKNTMSVVPATAPPTTSEAYTDMNADDPITLTSLENNTDNRDSIPYDALRTFVDVFDNIKQKYIEEVSNETLIDYAIRGMMSRLDPHSAFFNADEYHAFQESIDGQYTGIGALIDFQKDTLKIASVIQGSAAARAGLKSGDIIRTIDNQNTKDMTLQDATDLLTGNPGTQLKLGIIRGDDVLDFTLTRALVSTDSTDVSRPAPDILDIRIFHFQEDTAQAVKEAIIAQQKQAAIKGIILDLRDNPGGYLQSAVESADIFLNSGIILSVRDRKQREQQVYRAEQGEIVPKIPIVVLINHATASSAEIVAAALQENHRALLVGQTTYGKGSVQTIIPLADGGAIKLTTAMYYTPSGRQLQARGVEPDITLANIAINAKSVPPQESEASLYHHLKNNQKENADTLAAAQTARKLADARAATIQDFTLYEALNILRTLILAEQQPQQTPVSPKTTQTPQNKPPTQTTHP